MAVFKVFFSGAIFGVLLALIIELIFIYVLSIGVHYLRVYEIIAENFDKISILIPVVVIAPFAEEFSKLLCVLSAKKEIDELEDGLIYGAASGLGFSATENLLYEYNALVQAGVFAWISVSLMRSISSSLVHAGATAISGLGYSSRRLHGRGLLKGYLGAVLLHAVFNLVASVPLILSVRGYAYLFVLIIAICIAVLSFTYVRKSIIVLDRYYRKPRYT